MQAVSSRMTPIYRAGDGVTEWFDEYENDVNYMLWPSQISTKLNTYGRFWADMLDSDLHHHNQNTK